jgi:hypothetical protein
LIKVNASANKPAEPRHELIMSSGRRVEIRRQKRLFNDFFKIDELIVSHQQYDGRMSGEERRLVFERSDAVAHAILGGLHHHYVRV